MKIISFNVLCGRWEDRVKDVTDVIRRRMPDSFGLQEAHKDWMDAVCAALPEYDFVGVGRDDGKDGGEFSPVFYLRDRFTLVDGGTFWLNEKVTEPGLGWDARCPRVCSYALLKNNDTDEIYAHFNTHLDHIGPVAQCEGAKLIVRKMTELYPDVPSILTGDFNVLPKSEPYNTFIDAGLCDTRYMTEDSDINGTWTAFDENDVSTGDHTIDYIMTNDKNAVVKYFKVLRDRPDGRIPSDHDAVIAEFDLTK